MEEYFEEIAIAAEKIEERVEEEEAAVCAVNACKRQFYVIGAID